MTESVTKKRSPTILITETGWAQISEQLFDKFLHEYYAEPWNQRNQRLGQAFINYLSINYGVFNGSDSNLFYQPNAQRCIELIRERYLFN